MGAPWTEATPIGDGWWSSAWFGNFAVQGDWIFHGRHGWLYVVNAPGNGIYFFDQALGRWLWASPQSFPWIYAFGDSPTWLFWGQGSQRGARWFYRQDVGEWRQEGNLFEVADTPVFDLQSGDFSFYAPGRWRVYENGNFLGNIDILESRNVDAQLSSPYVQNDNALAVRSEFRVNNQTVGIETASRSLSGAIYRTQRFTVATSRETFFRPPHLILPSNPFVGQT